MRSRRPGLGVLLAAPFLAAMPACGNDSGDNHASAGDGGGCGIASCSAGFSLDENGCRCVQENGAGGSSGAGGSAGATGGSGGNSCGLARCSSGYSFDATLCACVPVVSSPPSLPKRGSWTAVNRTGAPSPRSGHTIVWTGTEYAVWGGSTVSGGSGVSPTVLGDGALYNPSTDSWRPMTDNGAPSPRLGHKSVWTGKYVAIFGHDIDVFPIQPMEGALYDPATDTWKPIAAAGAPIGRAYYDVVSADGKVVVWGGFEQAGVGTDAFPDATGGAYDPDIDTWTPIDGTNAPRFDGGHVTLPLTGGFLAYGSLAHFLAPDAGHTVAARYDLASRAWITVGERTNEVASGAYQSSAVVSSQLFVVTSTADNQRCVLEQLDLAASTWTEVTLAQSSGTNLECLRVSREDLLATAGHLVAVEPMRLVELESNTLAALAEVPYASVAETEPPADVVLDGWLFHASATDGMSVFVFGGSISGAVPFDCPPGAPCAAPQQYESAAYGALFTP